MLAWCGGCVQEKRPLDGSGTPVQGSNSNSQSAGQAPRNGDNLLGGDTCEARLQDIGGQLLQYYLLHGAFPPTLADLRSLPALDEPTDYFCPVSHQPYVYVPEGLQRPGDSQRLYVYDATPVHAGTRWGLLLTPPRRGSAATTANVLPLPEGLLAQYSAPPPATAPATRPASKFPN